jgi:Electron transfer DM13
MKRWKIVIPIAVIILFVAWYVFRPERLIVSQRVQEKLPAAESNSSNLQTLESGSFHSILHPTQGTATIYRLGDGSRVLRFTNFSTSNGPDVHVYMVAANDANDAATVLHAGFIDLGLIKGNVGDQNYTLGSDVDLSKYRAVSVWCKRFSVNFGTAPLAQDRTMSQR